MTWKRHTKDQIIAVWNARERPPSNPAGRRFSSCRAHQLLPLF
jgi:hypothetical protein